MKNSRCKLQNANATIKPWNKQPNMLNIERWFLPGTLHVSGQVRMKELRPHTRTESYGTKLLRRVTEFPNWLIRQQKDIKRPMD